MRDSLLSKGNRVQLLLFFSAVFLILFFINSTEVYADGCCIPLPHTDECFPVTQSSQCASPSIYQSTSCLSAVADEISLCAKGCCCDPARSADFIQCVNVDSNGVYSNPPFIQTDSYWQDGYCDTVCNQINQETFPISGEVYYSDGTTPAPARIALLSESGSGATYEQYSFSGVTKDDGSFSVDVSKEKTYKVTVTEVTDPTCFAALTPDIIMGSAAITGQKYILSCQAPNKEPCVPDWEITYEKPDEKCGLVLDAIDKNGCEEPGDPPIAIGTDIQCIPGGGETCKIDATHKCQRDASGVTFASGISEDCVDYKPEIYNYYSGKLSCTFDCQITTENCKSCPENVNDCTADLCSECPICDGLPVCETPVDCSKYYVELEQPVFDIPSKSFGVKWDYTNSDGESECDVDHYDLFGCEGVKVKGDTYECVNPYSQKPISLNIPSNVKEISIGSALTTISTEEYESLIGKYYCFTVKATSSDLSEVPSDIECVLISGGFCLDKEDGQYCENNAKTYCKDGTTREKPIPCEEYLCVDVGEQPHTEVECIGTDICDFCNGPLGMFGYLNHEFKGDDERFTGEGYQGLIDTKRAFYGLAISKNAYTCEETQKLNICYSDDYSLVDSPLGQYKACSTVENCYDYRTQKSCEGTGVNNEGANPCGFTASSNCEWVPLTESGETGLGVCRPQDLELQDCSVCDDNSPIGYCPKDICMLYSKDNCYYNELKGDFAIDTFNCMNYQDVGCETYDSESECTGSQNYQVDLTYNSLGEKQGTNVRKQPSDDIVKKGVCVWTDEGCVKDSDNTFSTIDSENGETLVSDCQMTDTECLLDNETPQTLLFSILEGGIYSKAEVGEVGYTVSDNVYSSEDDLQTFFSITKKNDKYVYPTKTRDELNSELLSLSGGYYSLYFFSKDKAENYEPVKRVNFAIMDDLDITVTKKIKYLYISSADVFESNLTITAVFTPDSRLSDHKAVCSSVLEYTPPKGKKQYFDGKGDDTLDKPKYEWNYTRLLDGDYTATITCNDNHGQTSVTDLDIVIDANPTISDPTPHGKVFRAGDVDISIKSQKESVCYYTEDSDLENADWTEFDVSSDGLTHTATVTPENDDDLNEGVYLYYPKCEFDKVDDNGKTVKDEFIGNPADIIYFAIDESPPEITVTGKSEGLSEKMSLAFKCTDNSLINPNQYLNFGCDSLRYCEYFTNSGSQCVPNKKPSGSITTGPEPGVKTFRHKVSAPPEGAPTKTILIMVNDTGGNQRIVSESLDKLRNMNFQVPKVSICDPLRGIPCE